VLRTDGGVKCWGANYGGELGNGTTSETFIPGAVDVLGLAHGVSAITAGNGYNCALTNSGEVKCWGYNAYGQLGGDAPTEGVPVDVVGLSGVIAVDVDGLSCALTGPGGVKCWGANNVGQLGDGTTTDSTVPVDVRGLGSGISAISVGGLHACALTAGGGVKCWGFNPYGQLGNDTTTNSAVPVDV
jgi:alpha-tubulin suppressor-like RCC1 family protein